jgi:FkbM family methyltransferase
VHAFEPSPSCNAQLRGNVATWPGASVAIHPWALSDRSGRAHLVIPPPEAGNPGLAALGEQGLEVETRTLDGVFGNARPLDLVKIDVEGHELEVLSGGTALLRDHAIRHIVFEEHRPVPSPVTRLLADHGYSAFSISYDVRGLCLKRLGEPNLPLPEYESPSYLATTQAEEALALLSSGGWQSLRGRP